MQPSEFYFLVLPLASIVFILVAVIAYYAREDSNKKLTEMHLIDELIRTGAIDKMNFATALQDLVEQKVIDKDSFNRMGKLIENYLDEPRVESKNELDEIYL
jgi:hypothetical protein